MENDDTTLGTLTPGPVPGGNPPALSQAALAAALSAQIPMNDKVESDGWGNLLVGLAGIPIAAVGEAALGLGGAFSLAEAIGTTIAAEGILGAAEGIIGAIEGQGAPDGGASPYDGGAGPYDGGAGIGGVGGATDGSP